MKLDAVIRQSRTSEHSRSPDDQRRVIAEWATGREVEIVAEHVGLGLSGKTMDRAGIKEAVARIRDGTTEGVVVAFLDRFSRAPTDDALAVCREIEQAGGKFFPIDLPNVDLSTPVGEFVLTMMLATARMQWRQTAQRYEGTRKRAIGEGKAVGGAPFGYRFTNPSPKGKAGVVDSRLVPDDTTAPIVRELFERKAGGATWLELTRWLGQVAPKEDGGLWARTTVKGMTNCRTYLGEVRSGKFVNPDAHDPLVTEPLFRKAQNGVGRRTPRGTYLLSGLAKCESCGRSLHGSTQGRKPPKGRKATPPRIYTCVNRSCNARPTIVSERLDEEVVDQFLTALQDFHLRAVDQAEVQAAHAKVEELTGQVEAMGAVVPSHPSAVAAHQEALSRLEGELHQAEDHLHDLTAPVDDVPDVADLRSEWPEMTLAERREMLRRTVAAVSVRRAPHPGAKVPTSERVSVSYRS